MLTPEQLDHAVFPLGDTVKDQVRVEAAARGLRVAAKPDSHDICFIADGDTRAWLGARLGRRNGPVVDTEGTVVGEHDGAHAFTVGQRHGLRLGRPAADGRPRYVLEVRPADNTVVVGPREALAVRRLEGIGAVWCGGKPRDGARVGVQIRAHAPEVPATVLSVDGGGRLAVRLDDPITGVAAGQTLALYAGTRVLGSATVVRARS